MKLVTLEIKFTKLCIMSNMVKFISKFPAIVTYKHGIILSDILVHRSTKEQEYFKIKSCEKW